MKGDKELTGTLRGFDEFVNMVLDDVTEIEITANGRREVSKSHFRFAFEYDLNDNFVLLNFFL